MCPRTDFRAASAPDASSSAPTLTDWTSDGVSTPPACAASEAAASSGGSAGFTVAEDGAAGGGFGGRAGGPAAVAEAGRQWNTSSEYARRPAVAWDSGAEEASGAAAGGLVARTKSSKERAWMKMGERTREGKTTRADIRVVDS